MADSHCWSIRLDVLGHLTGNNRRANGGRVVKRQVMERYSSSDVWFHGIYHDRVRNVVRSACGFKSAEPLASTLFVCAGELPLDLSPSFHGG